MRKLLLVIIGVFLFGESAYSQCHLVMNPITHRPDCNDGAVTNGVSAAGGGPLVNLSILAGAGLLVAQPMNATTDSGLNDMYLPGVLATGGITPVACPSAPAGCFSSFVGANPWGFTLPTTLTLPLWIKPPNAQPAANSFMLLSAPDVNNVSTLSYPTLSADLAITSGVLGLVSTAVTPGVYGDATHTPIVTVDAKGRITAASTVATSGSGGVGNPYPASISCSGTPTTVTAATHGQGKNPIWDISDQTGTDNKPVKINAITRASNGDMTFACSGSKTLVVSLSGSSSSAGPNYGGSFASASSVTIPPDALGFHSPYLKLQVYDGSGNYVGYDSFSVNTTTLAATFTFSGPLAGYAIIAQ